MAEDENLLDMSLDDLLNMEVSSVSKKAERLQDVASSLYVLTSEDIMNSGATSLHEVLMSKQIITRTETKITSKQGEIL
jgi:iron complex outermembrane receptor protein